MYQRSFGGPWTWLPNTHPPVVSPVAMPENRTSTDQPGCPMTPVLMRWPPANTHPLAFSVGATSGDTGLPFKDTSVYEAARLAAPLGCHAAMTSEMLMDSAAIHQGRP